MNSKWQGKKLADLLHNAGVGRGVSEGLGDDCDVILVVEVRQVAPVGHNPLRLIIEEGAELFHIGITIGVPALSIHRRRLASRILAQISQILTASRMCLDRTHSLIFAPHSRIFDFRRQLSRICSRRFRQWRSFISHLV